MSFPLAVGAIVVPDPPTLAAMVRDDSGPGSGRVVPGKRPAEWIVDLVTDGRLERRLAVGLAAALIQRPDAAVIGEGARLARRLGDPELGALILQALEAHDTALLLATDPGTLQSSIEDGLLAAAAALCDLGDDGARGTLLQGMRNAGLRALELRILLSHGSPEELEAWLPAVLLETPTEEERGLIEARAEVEDEGGRLIRAIVGKGT